MLIIHAHTYTIHIDNRYSEWITAVIRHDIVHVDVNFNALKKKNKNKEKQNHVHTQLFSIF